MALSAGTAGVSDTGVRVLAPAGVGEVLGASLAGEGGDLHLWFSGRAVGGLWRIHHTVSADSGATWSPPTAVAGLDVGATMRGRVLSHSVLRLRDGC